MLGLDGVKKTKRVLLQGFEEDMDPSRYTVSY